MTRYDVAIIGGGMGGLFAAYQLRKLDKDISIIILDKGRKLEERNCPASKGKPCTHCKVCAITSGLAGSGAFSDAKFNLGTANDDTLLYACESKYYSLKPKHNENCEVCDGVYLIGDGSGITRGLSQSAAMGLYVAERILNV